MEPARDPPWAEHERVYLLAEILKAAGIPSHVLYGLCRDYSIQPRWNDIALPQGRSLRSSQVAYENIAAANAGTDYRRPALPVASAPPIMYPAPEPSRKRPVHHESSASLGRLLQPRPPQTYAQEYLPVGGPTYLSTLTGEPANKKKRGRPTKAEAQQRAQEAAARGEVYPPPRRSRTSLTGPPEAPVTGTESQPPEQQTPPAQPATASLGPAITPQQQMLPEQTSEPSSGKKRRAKPHPLELENPPRPIGALDSPVALGSSDPGRNINYSSFTPISAPLPSSSESRDRDRDIRMEGIEETQPRTTTPHSFKDTVGI